MRSFLDHLAWGLATVALVVATPLSSAALERPPLAHPASVAPAGVAALPAVTARAIAPAMPNATRHTTVPIAESPETGRGWAELYCMGCVGLGTLALYSGGISMLPVILANPDAVAVLAGSCLMACRSVLETMMK